MNKLKIFIITAILFTPKAFTQSEVVDNSIGKKHIFQSETLNEERIIQIYVPESYKDSLDKKYPVLYILDGQRLFLHGVSVIQSFNSQFQLSPDMIVVGINNNYPNRFNHFLSTDFLDFIEREVVTHIDSNYRTSDERLIFGWEYAGAFAIESMISRPHLFDGHITASPYPINIDRLEGESRIDMLENKLEQSFNSFLYIAVSADEGAVGDGTNELEKLLKNKAPKTLRWNYRVIDGEEHRSTAYVALYHGLRKYYYDYPDLQVYSLEKFNKLGGMDYVYNYYKSRSKRFGFSEKLSPWTMFVLTRNALRADSFKDFEFFMNEFKDTDMLNGNRLDRAMSLATYYLKYHKHEAALKVYNQLIKNNIGSALLQNAIGDVYYTLKENTKARIYYEKSVSLAKAQKDSKLVDYQYDLKKLN